MKKCKKIQALLSNHQDFYKNSDEMKAVRRHLKQCKQCKDVFSRNASFLSFMNKRNRPQPSEAFNKMTWAEIKNKKETITHRETPLLGKFRGLRLPGSIRMVPVLSAAAFVAFGLFIGWIIFSPSDNQAIYYGKSEYGTLIRDAFFAGRAERLIDRSKVLLIGLSNFDSSRDDISILNLGISRKLSEEYLKEASFLHTNLDSSRQARLKRLISDLEFILMQIANLENEHDLEPVEIIKQGIDGRGILIKINLEEIDRVSRSSGDVKKKDNRLI